MRTALAAVALLAACQGTPEPQGAGAAAPAVYRPGMSLCEILDERTKALIADPERFTRGEVTALGLVQMVPRLRPYLSGSEPMTENVCTDVLRMIDAGRKGGVVAFADAAGLTQDERRTMVETLQARGLITHR